MMRFLAVRTLGLVATLAGWSLVLWLLLPPENGAFVGPAAAAAIGERLAVTLPLAAFALLLALGLGLPAALAGARRGGPADLLVQWASRVLLVPAPLWIGMLLVVVVAGMLRLLPAGGFMPWHQDIGGAIASLLLPAVALAIPLAAAVARLARAAFDGIGDAPHVLAARLLGVPSGRPSCGTAWAVCAARAAGGPLAGVALAGTMIVENVFYLPDWAGCW